MAALKKNKDLTKLAALDKDSVASDKRVEKAVGAKAKYYVVKRGDTLGIIAKRVLGSADRYKEIIALNAKRLKNPNRIYPNQKLLVSGEGKMDTASKVTTKEKSEKVKVAAVADRGKTDAPAEKKKPKYYVVKSGDSLWKIAKKVYGSGKHYKKLIGLNKKSLRDPSKIKINQKLIVS